MSKEEFFKLNIEERLYHLVCRINILSNISKSNINDCVSQMFFYIPNQLLYVEFIHYFLTTADLGEIYMENKYLLMTKIHRKENLDKILNVI